MSTSCGRSIGISGTGSKILLWLHWLNMTQVSYPQVRAGDLSPSQRCGHASGTYWWLWSIFSRCLILTLLIESSTRIVFHIFGIFIWIYFLYGRCFYYHHWIIPLAFLFSSNIAIQNNETLCIKKVTILMNYSYIQCHGVCLVDIYTNLNFIGQ